MAWSCGCQLTGFIWSWLMVNLILFLKLNVRLWIYRNGILIFWKLFLFIIFQGFSLSSKLFLWSSEQRICSPPWSIIVSKPQFAARIEREEILLNTMHAGIKYTWTFRFSPVRSHSRDWDTKFVFVYFNRGFLQRGSTQRAPGISEWRCRTVKCKDLI